MVKCSRGSAKEDVGQPSAGMVMIVVVVLNAQIEREKKKREEENRQPEAEARERCNWFKNNSKTALYTLYSFWDMVVALEAKTQQVTNKRRFFT